MHSTIRIANKQLAAIVDPLAQSDRQHAGRLTSCEPKETRLLAQIATGPAVAMLEMHSF